MLISCVLSYILQMTSKKRKAPSTPSQVRFDRSRFTSQEAWERYTDIVVPRKLLPERNVVVYYTEFDEFKEELKRRHWDEDELTPLEPFYFDANVHMAQEEETSTYQIPEPLPKPIPEETQPFAPVMELEQPIQDSSAALALDLNEDQPQDEQDV